MKFRAYLLASSLLYAVPALAMIDPPAASKNDGRLRSVIYDPNNPVEIYAAPGASLRIEVGQDETVATIVVSDQGTIAPDPNAPPPPSTTAAAFGNATAPQPPPSCDPNLCRTVVGNFIYLKPLRALDPQPLFIQTERTDEFGKPQMVPYTFELLTRPTDLKPLANAATPVSATADPPVAPTVWGVRFVYPERVKAAQTAAWLHQKHEAEATAAQMASIAHVSPANASASAKWRYGYRGAASVRPDQVWDDNGTTFIRFNGNRRVPNIYSKLPDGHESIPAVSPEPDATGNTLRIAGTETKWFIRDGDEAGCLFDLGPDPDGRTTTTVVQSASGVVRAQ